MLKVRRLLFSNCLQSDWNRCFVWFPPLLLLLVLVGCNRSNLPAYNVVVSSKGDTATVMCHTVPSVFKLKVINSSDYPLPFYITPKQVNLYNTTGIVQSLLDSSMTEAEKAFTLWRFVADYTWHSEPLSKNSQLLHNPGMLVNSFGACICDDVSAALVNLARTAGLSSRVVSLGGHVVAEVYYQNGWHMFDADMDNVFYDDKKNVCSVEQLETNPTFFKNSYKALHFVKQKMAEKTIGSSRGNYVNDWYRYTDTGYSSVMVLPGHGSVVFQSNKRFSPVQEKVHRESFPVYRNVGLAYSTVIVASDTVIELKSPYAIRQVNLKTTNALPADIFYSQDGNSWAYKGSFTTATSSNVFTTEGTDGSPFTFHCLIKLKLKGEQTRSMALKIENEFVFSDRALFNNTKRSFQLIRTDGKRWTNSDFKLQLN